jgi:hypothetical protein
MPFNRNLTPMGRGVRGLALEPTQRSKLLAAEGMNGRVALMAFRFKKTKES